MDKAELAECEARMMAKLRVARVPTSARIYAWAIWNSFGRRGRQCWRSQAKIAALLGIDQSTAYRMERAIERAGVWTVSREPGKGRSLRFVHGPPAPVHGVPLHSRTPSPDATAGGPRASAHGNLNRRENEDNSNGAAIADAALRPTDSMERAVRQAGELGVDLSGTDRISCALRLAVEEATGKVNNPAARVDRAWNSVLSLAKARPNRQHRAGFLVAAVAGEKSGIFQQELKRALTEECRREREASEAPWRGARLDQPRSPPPKDLMELFRSARERAFQAKARGSAPAGRTSDENECAMNGRESTS